MMPPFLTYREDREGLLCYYILQKAYPNYKAIVSVGPLVDSLVSAPVGGYNLYVNFMGVISGNFVPAHKDAMQEIESVMWQMASFFLNNRVLTEPKKYHKFKLNNDTAIAGK